MDGVTVEQVKAARILLRWHQLDLANAASVSLSSIKRYETNENVIPAIKAAIVRAMEDAGTVFETGKFVGVKVKAKRIK